MEVINEALKRCIAYAKKHTFYFVKTMDWHHGIGFAKKNDQTAVKKEENGFDFIRIEEQRRKRKLSIVTVEVSKMSFRNKKNSTIEIG